MCCQADWDLVASVSLLQRGLHGDASANTAIQRAVVSGELGQAVSQQRRSPGSELRLDVF